MHLEQLDLLDAIAEAEEAETQKGWIFANLPDTEVGEEYRSHGHAFELAEGEPLDIWLTPEGKLFFKSSR